MPSAIRTDDAPSAIGPYSQAVRAGSMLFISGQIPLDPATGEVVDGDIAAQTKRVMDSLDAILRAAGADFSQVVRTTIFLTDLRNFGQVNEVDGDDPNVLWIEVYDGIELKVLRTAVDRRFNEPVSVDDTEEADEADEA